jgi:peptidase A4-like protein
MVRVFPLPAAFFSAAMLAFVGAPSALADSTSSSNWAGYAAHRPGVRYTKVVGAWRQPSAACISGHQSYSAVWVGLGGYNQSSDALEQIGTEVDCSAAGRVSSSAWYELVPAPSIPITLRVRPGDAMFASVIVTGSRVVMQLNNTTTHQVFSKTLHASAIDVSSADWIVEAPSECTSATSCQTLPLADFGTAAIGMAQAQSTTGHTGSISDRAWGNTQIRLVPGGRRFVVYNGTGVPAGVATPSALTANGTSFRVAFTKVSLQGSPFLAARRTVARAGHLVHPLR